MSIGRCRAHESSFGHAMATTHLRAVLRPSLWAEKREIGDGRCVVPPLIVCAYSAYYRQQIYSTSYIRAHQSATQRTYEAESEKRTRRAAKARSGTELATLTRHGRRSRRSPERDTSAHDPRRTSTTHVPRHDAPPRSGARVRTRNILRSPHTRGRDLDRRHRSAFMSAFSLTTDGVSHGHTRRHPGTYVYTTSRNRHTRVHRVGQLQYASPISVHGLVCTYRTYSDQSQTDRSHPVQATGSHWSRLAYAAPLRWPPGPRAWATRPPRPPRRRRHIST